MIINKFPTGNNDNKILPLFTYTGNCTVVDDGDDGWRIKFLSSGTFKIQRPYATIDAFLVGGGASGSYSYEADDGSYPVGGGGGAGGYTMTQQNIDLSYGESYIIIVGDGGQAVGGGQTAVIGNNGGNTAAFGYTARGGSWDDINVINSGLPGNGGSAGGRSGYVDGSSVQVNAENGHENGEDSIAASQYPLLNVGKGQGTTTREFGEETGDLYAAGGGGGAGGDAAEGGTTAYGTGGACGGGDESDDPNESNETATSTYPIANFGVYSGWTVTNHVITSGPSTGREDKTISVTIPDGSTFVSASLQVTTGGTVGGANILSAGGHTLTTSATNIIDISDVVTGAGEHTLTFLFKDNGKSNLPNGQHGSTMQFTNASVTVTFTQSGGVSGGGNGASRLTDAGDGLANTGSGGGGGHSSYISHSGVHKASGAGGSGIVVIRNHRGN